METRVVINRFRAGFTDLWKFDRDLPGVSKLNIPLFLSILSHETQHKSSSTRIRPSPSIIAFRVVMSTDVAMLSDDEGQRAATAANGHTNGALTNGNGASHNEDLAMSDDDDLPLVCGCRLLSA